MKNQKGFVHIALVGVMVVLMAALVYLLIKNNTGGEAPNNTALRGNEQINQFETAEQDNQPTLETIFKLSEKAEGTKLYYSDKLGIGFTYLPYTNRILEINEFDNKITVDGPDGQWVEVFTKDPNMSVERAIEQRFLQGYDSTNCFVRVFDYTETFQSSEQNLNDYLMASITFPHSNDPDKAWWENADKCPPTYTTTNGISYFLYNEKVPNKYLFVSVGQYSAASDGTPPGTNPNFNWDRSIRILK